MGVGISQAMALAGHAVHLVDTKRRSGTDGVEALQTAVHQVDEGLTLLASIGLLSAAEQRATRRLIAFHGAESAEDALRESEVIFEAVPEVLAAKEDCYRRIGACARNDALIGSTTSTFNVETLAAYLPHARRFMNTHWLNPPTLMPLVEVVIAHATEVEAADAMLALLRDAGKVPVKCASSAGFIVPRIQALAMNEAARLVQEGVANPLAIDTACRLGLGVRFATMGLLEFIDWGGADVLFDASNYLADALGERYAPAGLVARHVEEGRLGMKTGSGFHEVARETVSDYQRETLRRLAALLKHLGLLTWSARVEADLPSVQRQVHEAS